MNDIKNRPKIRSGVYQILNTKNNKRYIGSSINVYSRMKVHKKLLEKNSHENSKLQRAYNKYKSSSFIFEPVQFVRVRSSLTEREQYWIDNLDSVRNGYNICPKAESSLGVKHSKETRKKHSLRTRGEGNPMYGKHHSEEAKRKISEFRKTFAYPESFRAKMSRITSGENNPMYGRNHKKKSRDEIAMKLAYRGGHSGKNNPMYGRNHSDKSKGLIRMRIEKRGGMKGDRNPNHKIKEKEHKYINNQRFEEGRSISSLAREYGVAWGTIKNIIKKDSRWMG